MKIIHTFKTLNVDEKFYTLIWCLVVCWQIMYVPIIVAGLIALVAWLSKTFKEGLIYWLEMMAFGATFATVIIQLLILL